jgi:hypothetical protein
MTRAMLYDALAKSAAKTTWITARFSTPSSGAQSRFRSRFNRAGLVEFWGEIGVLPRWNRPRLCRGWRAMFVAGTATLTDAGSGQ